MAVLYVDEYGSCVRFSNGRIVIEKDDEELASVRIQEIDYIVIYHNCSITSAAIGALLSNGVETSFIGGGGQFLGKLEGIAPKNIALRKSQYKLSDDNDFCLDFARRFVAGKIANMRTILMRYARSMNNQTLSDASDKLKALAKQAGSAESLEQILGFEGTSSREYFKVFREVLSEPFTFDGRVRRPPGDPVNAMLGFAYALLENTVESAISSCSLDPFCGFFHKEYYGRQSLVFDLMEEFRPVIADSVVISCTNRSIVDIEKDFEEMNGGVYLNESGRQKFFKAFRTRINEEIKIEASQPQVSYTKICIGQAMKIVKSITSGKCEYEPFLIK